LFVISCLYSGEGWRFCIKKNFYIEHVTNLNFFGQFVNVIVKSIIFVAVFKKRQNWSWYSKDETKYGVSFWWSIPKSGGFKTGRKKI